MDTRRIACVLAGLIAAVTLAQAGPGAQTAPPAVPQVRLRWQDFASGQDGARRLSSLQKAVQKMKSLNAADPTSADFRRSWTYWANIHGYYGTQSPDGTVQEHTRGWEKKPWMAQYLPYYAGVPDQTPPDAIATTTWATCQHGGPPGAFFGWHRMYLYYFEQVLRWAAQDSSLRLPYWDYTDPAQLALPAPYQKTTSVFYDARRDPQINTGASTLSGDSTNIDSALGMSDFFAYESNIEGGVHGYVHCTVGPNCPVADLGDVPLAGNDPIFYSHHANIDRMWACWQNLYPTPPGAWQDQTFSFPDAAGALQTKPIKEYLDSARNGYVYDNTTTCTRPAPVKGPAATGTVGQGAPNPTVLAAAKGVAVTAALTQVSLGAPKAQVKSALAGLAPGGRIALVLHDVAAESPPGVIFDVFLSNNGARASRRHVGTISFFGAFHRRQGTAHDDMNDARMATTLELNVTNAVRALGDADLMVEIEATDGRTVVDPAAAEAARKKVASAFRADAKLTIGSIELRSMGAGPQK